MSPEDQLLRRLRRVGRMRIALQEQRFGELPPTYNPAYPDNSAEEIKEALDTRIDRLLQDYVDLTGDTFDPMEYEDAEYPLMAFTWGRAPAYKISDE